MIARWVPLIGLALFFGIGLLWRSWLQRRRYGTAGIILFRSMNARQRVRDTLFVVLLLLTTVQAVVAAVSPESMSALCIAAVPAGGFWFAAGAGLLFGGTFLMVLAQLHLGASWRIGIDEGAKPGLVTDGLYRFCRNPIFFGMFVTLA